MICPDFIEIFSKFDVFHSKYRYFSNALYGIRRSTKITLGVYNSVRIKAFKRLKFQNSKELIFLKFSNLEVAQGAGGRLHVKPEG